METRAHHLLIGSFVLIMVGALFAFLVWLVGADIDREYVEYDVYFEESVAGLSRAGDVRYNGVPVGQVLRIMLAPNDPGKVLVQVKIDSTVPILEDSVAVLAMQGLTGIAFVQIEGGSPDSAPLQPVEGEEHLVIRSRTSPIQEFFVGGPDLINATLIAVGRINMLLGDDNLTRVADILDNSAKFTGGLADRTEDAGRVLTELELALKEFRATAKVVQSVASKAGALLDEDGQAAMADLKSLLHSGDLLIAELRAVVSENKGAVAAFTSGTLPEISRLVSDARRLAIALSHLAERLEDNAADVIFNAGPPEFEVE